MRIDMEMERDICRRLYDEMVKPRDERSGSECFMDGLWLGLSLGGMERGEWDELEGELVGMFDALCQGEWG